MAFYLLHHLHQQISIFFLRGLHCEGGVLSDLRRLDWDFHAARYLYGISQDLPLRCVRNIYLQRNHFLLPDNHFTKDYSTVYTKMPECEVLYGFVYIYCVLMNHNKLKGKGISQDEQMQYVVCTEEQQSRFTTRRYCKPDQHYHQLLSSFIGILTAEWQKFTFSQKNERAGGVFVCVWHLCLGFILNQCELCLHSTSPTLDDPQDIMSVIFIGTTVMNRWHV